MKEQYVGDVSDYRKYALLRHLAAGGDIRIGVCWMLTLSDGGSDGGKTKYLAEPKLWRGFDPPLFDLLSSLIAAPDLRRLRLIEESGIVPGASYWNELTPDRRGERERYFTSALAALSSADLIFFDPDNGIEIASKPKGRKGSSKFLFKDEIAATYQAGHSVLIYQHFPFIAKAVFLERTAAALSNIAPDAEVWLFETAHVAFMLMVQPAHRESIHLAIERARASEHRRMFRSIKQLVLVSEYCEPPSTVILSDERKEITE